MRWEDDGSAEGEELARRAQPPAGKTAEDTDVGKVGDQDLNVRSSKATFAQHLVCVHWQTCEGWEVMRFRCPAGTVWLQVRRKWAKRLRKPAQFVWLADWDMPPQILPDLGVITHDCRVVRVRAMPTPLFCAHMAVLREMLSFAKWTGFFLQDSSSSEESIHDV